MENNSVTLSYKRIGTIALLLINLIIIGPGGWMLKTLWNDTLTFREETDKQLESLKKQIVEVRVELSSKYVTKNMFSNYRQRMEEGMKYLDSKITNVKHHEK